jgi:hypothetical protein
MRRVAFLAAAGLGLPSFISLANGQVLETFGSPDALQNPANTGTTQYYLNAIYDQWSTSNSTLNYNTTNFEVIWSGVLGNGYGSAYHSIYADDNTQSISISGSNALQLIVTLPSGPSGPIIQLGDGSTPMNELNYTFGVGLTGNAASDQADITEPGETIVQGTLPNQIILTMPFSDGVVNEGSATKFNFGDITEYNIENQPGGVTSDDIQWDLLQGVTVPEPATLSLIGGFASLLLARRRTK